MVHTGHASSCLLSGPKRGVYLALGDHVHAVIVEKQPVVMALD